MRRCATRPPHEIDRFLNAYINIARMTPGGLRIDAVAADPSDNKYLACAVEGNAAFIISGDRHLTDLQSFRGIRITSPAEFLKIAGQP